jgi:hypothetical protein
MKLLLVLLVLLSLASAAPKANKTPTILEGWKEVEKDGECTAYFQCPENFFPPVDCQIQGVSGRYQPCLE